MRSSDRQRRAGWRQVAAGGTLSFEPEPEEDALLPESPAGRSRPAARHRPADEARRRGRGLSRESPIQGAATHRRRPNDRDDHPMSTTTINAETVKELRERTGAGFMDCKRALEETGGDLDAGRRSSARARPGGGGQEGRPRGPRGLVASYIHPGGRVGRAHRGQLRDRLRGPHRRVPEARPRPRDAGRRPGARCTRPSSRSRPRCSRPSARELLADEAVQKKPERDPRADRRRPAQEVVPAGRARGAALPRHRR